MKIFGITFTTKKELRRMLSELYEELEICVGECTYVRDMFPLDLGQVVYDISLKNDRGRYTKTKPSLEYSTITKVTVDEKNYFSLVNRFRHNDVFSTRAEAEEYLKSICK